MHELLQKIRIGISLGFRFPLAAWRYVRCAHMELQFVRNLGASCRPCVFPVTSRFATGTPALPRYAPRSVTIGSAGRITGQTVPGSTVQRQPLQQCAKISSENRALFFEMPPSFKILKCNWMWPGRAGLVHPSFLIVL